MPRPSPAEDLDDATRQAVDRYFASTLGFQTGDLRRAVVRVVPGRHDGGALLLRLGRACIVQVAADRLEAAATVVRHLTPDQAFDRGVARTLAGEGAAVHGPSQHSYLSAERWRRARTRGSQETGVDRRSEVERLDRLDPRLLELRGSVDLDEWAEGGFALEPGEIDPTTTALYGVTRHGRLVAAGNLTEWRGAPGDVGLLTRPGHRGEGLATAVAAAMIHQWLPRVGIIRYRALSTNTASLSVASRLGFIRYGQNIVARPGR